MTDERPPEATAETNSEVGFLPDPPPGQKHGLYSKRSIIRALLSEKEAEAWDLAPIPSDCPEALEEVLREYFVMKYRVHAYTSGLKVPAPGDLEAVGHRLRLLHLPLRGILKSIEVHARIREAETAGDMGDAVLAHLRTLPSHQLASYLTDGEAPRFDPGTGRPLLPVSRETQEEVHDDVRREEPGDREPDPSKPPDERGPGPGGGPEGA